MYGEFLLAEDEMTKGAMSSLEKCADILKKNPRHKQ